MNEQLTYEAAMARLQDIARKIEQGEMNIDSLAANLKEAQALAKFCKDKLTAVEADVKEILADKDENNS